MQNSPDQLRPAMACETFSPVRIILQNSVKKNAGVNYHSRDLFPQPQQPLSNYTSRRVSQYALNDATKGTGPIKPSYSTKAAKMATESSEKELKPVRRVIGRSSGPQLPKRQIGLSPITNHGSATANRSHQRVAYWAGLRVEGGLKPFGINADQLTRWNEKVHSGGICNTSKS